MFGVLFVVILVATSAIVIAIRSHLHKRYAKSIPQISGYGTVHTTLAPEGSVLIGRELWPARSSDNGPVPEKAYVRIVGFKNHLLLVKRDYK